MSSVHRLAIAGPAIFACAQRGCPVCVERLLAHHAGLIPLLVRRQWLGEAIAYADLVQEGRIALWQAILHFDPARGSAFSSYAGVAIGRRIWDVVARAERRSGYLPIQRSPDPALVVEAMAEGERLRQAIVAALAPLPDRRRRVIIAVYGLDGLPPRSLAALGRQYGVSRERVRQWRNDALLRLRIPALSPQLWSLGAHDSRQAALRAQARHRQWLRYRRARWSGRRGGQR